MRYLHLVAVLLVLAAALLVFPNRIPEFAGLWLVWCSFRMLRDQPTRWELLAIPVWIFIKWPEPTWALGIFLGTVLVVSLRGNLTTKSNRWTISPGVLWIAWAVWLVHHHAGTYGRAPIENPAGPIVCLGDSLTDYGYPDELKKTIQKPVADFGFSGYTTDDGLKLMPQIVALEPSVVIIELGGHDYNTGQTRQHAAANLRRLIESFQNCDAKVVIVEVARGVVNDPWYGMERQLAREYDLDLIPDTMMRRLFFWGPIVPPGSLVSDSWRLSEDGLHPNDAGNRMMANTVAGYLD